MIIRYAAVSSFISRLLGLALPALLAGAHAPAAAAPPLKLERVVILMRHGVRPPTKAPAMPAGFAADAWPQWSSPPGHLTAHGAAAVRLLGLADRDWYRRAGLLRGRCPSLQIISDSDQRTIATGDAYLAALAPGCHIANRHRAQDETDPLFQKAGENGVPFDPATADAAVVQALGPGGIAAIETRHRAVLERLDRILCGRSSAACGVGRSPTQLLPARPNGPPKLAGALDRGSTAAQILLLEYAEGKPLAEVGWGRADAADITALSALHSVEFAILARPYYLAARNVGPLARVIAEALAARGPDAPVLVALIGHDTNVASLGGLLDLHWQAPGYARDDPPPGGGILIELLRDPAGRRFVRAGFRAQSLDQVRSLSETAPYRSALTIGGCGTLCPLDRFLALLRPKT